MCDTLAMNKMYEDDRWPWGDQMDKNKTKLHVLFGAVGLQPFLVFCFLS